MTTPDELAKIRRQLDADLERRLAEHHQLSDRKPAQAQEPRERATMEQKTAAAWERWIAAKVDHRLNARMGELVEPIGQALATVRREMRTEIKSLLAELKRELLTEARRGFAVEIARIKDEGVAMATDRPRYHT